MNRGWCLERLGEVVGGWVGVCGGEVVRCLMDGLCVRGGLGSEVWWFVHEE